MLCGAPSWLSKAMVNGLPALAATVGVGELQVLGDDRDGVTGRAAGGDRALVGGRRRARTGGQHGGQDDQAEGEGQALHVGGLLGLSVVEADGSGAGGDGAATADQAGEGGELAADDARSGCRRGGRSRRRARTISATSMALAM